MAPTNSKSKSNCNLGFLTERERDTETNFPRSTRVKNKTPAPVQLTSDQIVRESRAMQEAEIRPPEPEQKITHPTELAEYRFRKRKEYEDLIKRVSLRGNVSASAWVKYAQWEERQQDFARARSLWEKALHVHYRNHTLWLKYAQFEMRNRFLNRARNVWDRAVSLLPRVDQLWYKYIHMEEMLGNVPAARQVFERWMKWQPDTQGWLSYIKFELRYCETERARGIYKRFVDCHPRPESFIRYAKFEMKHGEISRARAIYVHAADLLADDEGAETLFLAFAEFEERCNETERARCIYKFALARVPKSRAEDLYKKYLAFEKQFGDKEGIDGAIVGKRRLQYEEEVRKNPLNYDSWFDYARLEEGVGNKKAVHGVYERAIANMPPAEEKRYWQRYIYLWINYALYEELDAQDVERTRDVYCTCLKLIPHKKFSFAKIWLMAFQFEIRQKNLNAARQILDNAIECCITSKDKIFKKYIEIELQLGNIDGCRTLYVEYLKWSMENCYAWTKFAELERSLGETERARAIYKSAIKQPALDMPELLWKAYIDFEISERNFKNTRELYESLLRRTKHLKVWLSYAKFEASADYDNELLDDKGNPYEEDAEAIHDSLAESTIVERALEHFSPNESELKEERAILLEEWLNVETSFGVLGDVSRVRKKLPRKVKRKRAITTEDSTLAGCEEYIVYIFPDEAAMAPNLKILEAAYKWKKQKV